MKIFHEEDGKEVVYVQIADIDYLCKKGDEFKPAFVEKYKYYVQEASNLFKFIRIDEKEAVDFFKNADFIINPDDYKKFSKRKLKKRFSKRKLKKEIKSVTNDVFGIADIWLDSNGKQALELYHDVQYKLAFLNELKLVIYKGKYMPFPDFVKIP